MWRLRATVRAATTPAAIRGPSPRFMLHPSSFIPHPCKVGCLSRIGCLTLGMFVGVVALAGLLATRHVGPRAVEGGFRYQAGGRERTVLLSDAAARSFDAKVNGQLPSAAALEAVAAGVPITEEELNSRIAEEVARRPLGEYGATVDRVFVRLTPSGAIAYVYSTVRGVAVVLHSDLVFDLERGALRVELRDPHVG